MIKKLLIAIALAVAVQASAQLSVETIGAVRLINIDDGEQYGAGAALSYDFNKYVRGFTRLLAYKTPDEWAGSAIDETSFGAVATFLRSANNKVSLSAVGAVNLSFGETVDRGIGLGGRAEFVIYKKLKASAQAEYRVWDEQKRDVLLTVGISYPLPF